MFEMTKNNILSFELDHPMKRPRVSTEIDTSFYDRKIFPSNRTDERPCMLSELNIEHVRILWILSISNTFQSCHVININAFNDQISQNMWF